MKEKTNIKKAEEEGNRLSSKDGQKRNYNSALGRFKVQFEKDSDLIAPSETDDTEM